jgi:hypothetical protein
MSSLKTISFPMLLDKFTETAAESTEKLAPSTTPENYKSVSTEPSGELLNNVASTSSYNPNSAESEPQNTPVSPVEIIPLSKRKEEINGEEVANFNKDSS